MPECVADWAGFLESELSDQGDDGLDVHVTPIDTADLLLKWNSTQASSINDTYMRNPEFKKFGSFDDIADLIEENL